MVETIEHTFIVLFRYFLQKSFIKLKEKKKSSTHSNNNYLLIVYQLDT